MEEVIKLDSIDRYNKLYGLETLHPLVSVVDLSEATTFPKHAVLNFGVYALYLKQVKCGDLRYGTGRRSPDGGRRTAHVAWTGLPSRSDTRNVVGAGDQAVFVFLILLQRSPSPVGRGKDYLPGLPG